MHYIFMRTFASHHKANIYKLLSHLEKQFDVVTTYLFKQEVKYTMRKLIKLYAINLGSS